MNKNLNKKKETSMRKILIIGAGGIGSHLIPALARTNMYDITVFDPDIVEIKNSTYQNLNEAQVGETKVAAMNQSWNINAQPYKVLTKKQIKGYELVVCCADNLTIRQTLYKTENKWLDLRAQGRNGLLVSYEENKKILAMLNVGPDGSFSCQGDKWDGTAGDIHFTHIAIAGMGAQWIQRWFAGEDVKKNIQLSI